MATGAAVRPCVRAVGVLYAYVVRCHHMARLWECVPRSGAPFIVRQPHPKNSTEGMPASAIFEVRRSNYNAVARKRYTEFELLCG